MNASENLHGAAFQHYAGCSIMPVMKEKRIYLREWRKHLGKTQSQVVASLQSFDDPNLPTTEASLSRIETGKQPWSQRVLEALADIYGIELWELLGRKPGAEGEILDMVSRMDDRQRKQALAVMKALTQPGASSGEHVEGSAVVDPDGGRPSDGGESWTPAVRTRPA